MGYLFKKKKKKFWVFKKPFSKLFQFWRQSVTKIIRLAPMPHC